MILVTRGAGFISANFVLDWLEAQRRAVVNLGNKPTPAISAISPRSRATRGIFVRGDIGDRDLVMHLLGLHRPRAIINFMRRATSSLDSRSADFIATNIVGTFALLMQCAPTGGACGRRARAISLRAHLDGRGLRLARAGCPFVCGDEFYAPNQSLLRVKASADHLVRAYHHTYGLPTLTTNCSNNYGPRQFPEKLIPLMLHNGLAGKPLPIYGDGGNVRDWLYVGDHCAAIRIVLERGQPGQTYNVGGNAEIANVDVVRTLCRVLGEQKPGCNAESLITFVKDRAGHAACDRASKSPELGWRPAETFESGLRKTVRWYLDNAAWLTAVTSGEYQKWISLNYAAEAA
jgi:dTDP-glucose 4,6-dehydratase